MAESAESHLVFACGDAWYAVRADRASEIVTFPELTKVPSAPSHVLGVFAHRGEVVPVIDLGLLRSGQSEASERGVLLRGEKGVFAVTTTRVSGVSAFAELSTAFGSSGFLWALKGPTKAADREIALIDIDAMLEFLAAPGRIR